MRLRDEMPELDGATAWLNSGALTKEDLIGSQPTLIHFWAVSCSLCKETMPQVNALREELKDELNIIAVHMPRSEADLDVKQVQQVAAAHHMSQPIYVDNKYQLTDAFNNQHVPAYYLFDSNGKLRHYQAGGGGMKMLRKRVNRVLEL